MTTQEPEKGSITDAVLWLHQSIKNPGFGKVIGELLQRFCPEAQFTMFGRHTVEIRFEDGTRSLLTLMEQHA